MRVELSARTLHWRRILLTGVAVCALGAASVAANAQSTDAQPKELPALPEMKLDVDSPPDVPTPPIPVDGMPPLPAIPTAANDAPPPSAPAEPLPAAPLAAEPAATAVIPPADLSEVPAAAPAPAADAAPEVQAPLSPTGDVTTVPAAAEEMPAPAVPAEVPSAPPAVPEGEVAAPPVAAIPAPAGEEQPEPNKAASPDAPADQPADKPSTKAAKPTVKAAAAGADADADVEWSGTLMFDPARMDQMNTVYEQYLLTLTRKVKAGDKNASGPDIAKIIENKLKGKEIKEETLEFSLDSILYYTDADWSIWVSGKRYFRDEAMAGFDVGGSRLAVTDVNSHEVNFVWTPISESFDKVEKRWEDKQRLSENGPSPQLAVGERVEFDTDAQIVNILMRPNQTFVSTFMSVLEGRENRAPVAAIGKDKNESGAKDAKAPDAATDAAPAGTATGEPSLTDLQKMPAGNAKDRAMADHLSNMYKNAFPGMTKAIEDGERLETPAPTQ